MIPTGIREGYWRGETAVLAEQGREVLLDQVIISHRAADGQRAFISLIARDIADPKRSEEHLR